MSRPPSPTTQSLTSIACTLKVWAQVTFEARRDDVPLHAVLDRWMRERRLAEGIRKLRPNSIKTKP